MNASKEMKPGAVLVRMLLALAFIGASGCVHRHLLPSVTFSVRVIDVDSGLPVKEAEVTAFLRTREAPVPDIYFAPILTDVIGNALVHCPERSIITQGITPSWKGGYNTWPALRVRHPAYEEVTRDDGNQLENDLTKTGEVVVALKKKAAARALPAKP